MRNSLRNRKVYFTETPHLEIFNLFLRCAHLHCLGEKKRVAISRVLIIAVAYSIPHTSFLQILIAVFQKLNKLNEMEFRDCLHIDELRMDTDATCLQSEYEETMENAGTHFRAFLFLKCWLTVVPLVRFSTHFLISRDQRIEMK